MEPIFRCATRKAIDELAQELNLPNEEWMQNFTNISLLNIAPLYLATIDGLL